MIVFFLIMLLWIGLFIWPYAAIYCFAALLGYVALHNIIVDATAKTLQERADKII